MSELRNLFEETERFFKRSNVSFDDIKEVIVGDTIISKERFIELAKETNYDAYEGPYQVCAKLEIHLKNGHRFERRIEYKENRKDNEYWCYVPPRRRKKRDDNAVISLIEDCEYELYGYITL